MKGHDDKPGSVAISSGWSPARNEQGCVSKQMQASHCPANARRPVGPKGEVPIMAYRDFQKLSLQVLSSLTRSHYQQQAKIG